MPDTMIYIPVNKELYDDIIRFSDGSIDPAELVDTELQSFLERTVEGNGELWGDRLYEVAAKYAPEVLERWRREDAEGFKEREEASRPLVWKEVTIANGAEVRMFYGDKHHFAVVRGGHIVDDEKPYSPSEWASKIAAGTSRNAWRDLWFREPLSKMWVPASLMREQAQQELAKKGLVTEIGGGDND
jgi:hypothetical protein